MSRFIETIRIENGCAYNLELHEQRMNRTRKFFFPECAPLSLAPLLTPDGYKERTRCRIEYRQEVVRIEYLPYRLREVKTLRCVTADELDYGFKYADRNSLNTLYDGKGEADEILIVRNNFLTDTSICNIALWNGLQWHTPAFPLLEGTMRQSLLDKGLIESLEITPAMLDRYEKVRLFNAMIDFGEVELPISSITGV